MDLRTGFKIEEPTIQVPWSATEQQVRDILSLTPPRRVARGYLTLPVRVLGGLSCNLGFHFRPGPELTELEFFRTIRMDLNTSFREFQSHFEKTFGPPSRIESGDEGFLSHEWLVPGAQIVHFVRDRFGPEEHMRIRRVA